MAELQGDPNAAIKELRKQVSNSLSLVKNSLTLGPKRLDFWFTISTLIRIFCKYVQ